MRLSNAAEVSAGTLAGQRIDAEEQPGAAEDRYAHACNSRRHAAMTARGARDTRPCAWQRQRRRLVTIEAVNERIRIIETFRPHMLRERLRERA